MEQESISGSEIELCEAMKYMDSINKESVNLVLTDPPYITSRKTGMDSLHKNVALLKEQKKDAKTEEEWEQWTAMENNKGKVFSDVQKKNYMKWGTIYGKKYAVVTDYGNWDTSFTIEMLESIVKEYYEKLVKGGTCIIFFDLWKITKLKDIMEDVGFKQIRFIEWIKTNPQPLNSGTNYLTNAREIALLGVKGAKPTFNSKYDNGLYYYPLQGGAQRFHPTQKNEKMFEDLIKKHSNEGDVVLDTFMGSGTTAVACKTTKRVYKGCEADEEYHKKSEERISRF